MLNEIMDMAAYSGNRQFSVLEKVASNVGNFNTTAYKVKRFEHYLTPDGNLTGTDRVDYTPGAIMLTRRDMDIAIDGPGFIPITQPDGQIAYTRDGSFTKDRNGMLVTQRGDLVGEGIQLPINYAKLLVLNTGEVQVLQRGEITPKTIGKINLVNFPNPEGLKSVGFNKVLETVDSGQPVPFAGDLKQGALERSNVNMHYQIDQILRLNAGLISNFRVIKFADEIFRQAVNLKQ